MLQAKRNDHINFELMKQVFQWKKKNVKSRVAINFESGKSKTEETIISSQDILKKNEESKIISPDGMNMPNNHVTSETEIKSALNKNNSAAQDDESSLQDDDPFDMDVQEIIDSFLRPYCVTEDYLSSSDLRSPLVTPRYSAPSVDLTESPSMSNKTLQSTSRFLSTPDVDCISLIDTHEEEEEEDDEDGRDEDHFNDWDFSEMSSGNNERAHSPLNTMVLPVIDKIRTTSSDERVVEEIKCRNEMGSAAKPDFICPAVEKDVFKSCESTENLKMNCGDGGDTLGYSNVESVEELLVALKDNLETNEITEYSTMDESCQSNFGSDCGDDDVTSNYFELDGSQSSTSYFINQSSAGCTENSHPSVVRSRVTLFNLDHQQFLLASPEMKTNGCLYRIEVNHKLELSEVYQPETLVLSRPRIIKKKVCLSRSSESVQSKSIQTDSSFDERSTNASLKSSGFSDTVQRKEINHETLQTRSLQGSSGGQSVQKELSDCLHWSGDVSEVKKRREHLERKLRKGLGSRARNGNAFIDSSFSEKSELAFSTETVGVGAVSPDHEEMSKWKLEKLQELERRKMEIMNMNPRDVELMYLRAEEERLRLQLRRVRNRMRQLELLHDDDLSTSSHDETNTACVETTESFLHRLTCSPKEMPDHTRPDSTKRELFEPTTSEADSHTISTDVDYTHFETQDHHGDEDDDDDDDEDDDSPSTIVSCVDDMTHKQPPACNKLEQRKRAAFELLCSKLAPIVKGFIARRLFKCDRVKELVVIIKDTRKEIKKVRLLENEPAECGVGLFSEDKLCQQDTRKDINKAQLNERRPTLSCRVATEPSYELKLHKQLSTNFRELHEIFFSQSSSKRMVLIARQREKDLSTNYPSPRKAQPTLSLATRKSMGRKEKMREKKLQLSPVVHRSTTGSNRDGIRSTVAGDVPKVVGVDCRRRRLDKISSRNGNQGMVQSVRQTSSRGCGNTDSGMKHSNQKSSFISRTSRKVNSYMAKNVTACTRSRARPN